DSKSPSDACMDAAGFTRKLTDILGQDETAAYNLRIAASEGTYPVLASKPSERDVPALAGVGEIADLLGVPKQRVHHLTASPESLDRELPPEGSTMKASVYPVPDEPARPDEPRVVRPRDVDPDDPRAQAIARFADESEELAREPLPSPGRPAFSPWHSLDGRA